MMSAIPEHLRRLQGLRVLVVEDEALIAWLLEDFLTDLGCTVVGPAVRMEDAIRLAREAEIDGATLDINIGGEKVYPVADILTARNIPFVFTTGYGVAGLRAADSGRAVLQKPYRVERLAEVMMTWG